MIWIDLWTTSNDLPLPWSRGERARAKAHFATCLSEVCSEVGISYVTITYTYIRLGPLGIWGEPCYLESILKIVKKILYLSRPQRFRRVEVTFAEQVLPLPRKLLEKNTVSFTWLENMHGDLYADITFPRSLQFDEKVARGKLWAWGNDKYPCVYQSKICVYYP